MKKRSTLLALLGAVFLLSLFLVACGNGGTDGTDGGTDGTDSGTEVSGNGDEVAAGDTVPARIRAMMQTSMPESDDVIDGGVLRFARVDGSPFAGVLHPIWSASAPDANIHDFFLGTFMTVDDDFLLELGDEGRGPVRAVISDDQLTITFTIQEGVYWHDGEPLTARDLEFAYEVLGHPDSTAVRWGQQNEQFIVGGTDFHEGRADSIEGVTIIDDRTLQVEFMEVRALRETVFPWPVPYHRFADIPIEEMEYHPYVRTEEAIGWGPFIIDRIVPGESVTFTRNDNYWQGVPLLEGVEYRIVAPATIGEELRAGNVDVAHTFTEANYEFYGDLSNITYLKSASFVFTYICFRVGYWDVDLGQSVLNPDATMADVNLRRAMWMAVDNDLVTEVWRGGMRWEASTLIPPAFMWHNPNAQRPSYDMDAAHALLDEAGYTFDGDWRTNPDGSPLEINVFAVIRDSNYDAVYEYYLQQWRELGLNVDLVDIADLPTSGDWFAIDGTENTEIDVFMGGAWSTGTNPNPYGLFGRSAAFNRSRYVSERNDELLGRIGSERAIGDMDYRREAFYEWQEYMIENASLFPTEFRFNFIPVNNRVVNFEIVATHNPRDGWHLVGLTHDEPLAD